MQLGIFAKTFVRPTLEATLDAVQDHGLDCVQFNMACAGLPSLPERIPLELGQRIRKALADRGMTMAAVSGTFNMIHPDPQQCEDGLRRLQVLAEACPRLGARIITLCTGTRDPDNMWRWHNDNDSPAAWLDLLTCLGEALHRTEASGVVLAVEPETANVIDSARKAHDLVQQMQNPRLKIVIDPANLFRCQDLTRQQAILDEAFTLLADDIILAHAKDFVLADGEVRHVAAGKGQLDYACYLRWLERIGFAGALILHGLAEDEVRDSVAFLRLQEKVK
jgi:sugar phosphate isomerase/epimerase